MNAFEACDLPEFVCEIENDKIERIENLEWYDLAHEYRVYKNQIKLLEKLMDEIKDRLIEMADKDICIGGGIELQKITKKGSIQYDKIEELQFVDLEKYRKPSTEYWKVSEI
jgi:hypothetical protein